VPKAGGGRGHRRILRCDGAPFSVEIGGAEPRAERRSFRLTGLGSERTPELTQEYDLPVVSQNAYRALFERVAEDFGTRSPIERHDVSSGGGAMLQALLTETISPDVLYGYGDPGALRVPDGRGGSTYYVVVTSNDAPQSFPILTSPDLRVWQLAGFVFPRGAAPAWTADVERGGEFWAPEMHVIGDRFVVCFAAREADGSLAIGLASSASATGPFVATERPLVRGGVIDPNLFVDDDGSAMLCWKRDDNALWPGLLSDLLRESPHLVAELFDDDGDARTAQLCAVLSPWTSTLSPMERFFVHQVLIAAVVSRYVAFRTRLEQLRTATGDPGLQSRLTVILGAMETAVFAQPLDVLTGTLLGEPRVILTNDLPWEGHLVEGPWVTKQQGRYYIFYAGNDFSTPQYGIGVGVADSPFGPYTKTAVPFLRSTPQWWGPGHPSIADGPDGRPWMFLHAFRPGHAGYKHFRALLGLPLAFADGVVRPG
jgi:arabinan endo-1,5-alpha-L-arabinosidase